MPEIPFLRTSVWKIFGEGCPWILIMGDGLKWSVTRIPFSKILFSPQTLSIVRHIVYRSSFQLRTNWSPKVKSAGTETHSYRPWRTFRTTRLRKRAMAFNKQIKTPHSCFHHLSIDKDFEGCSMKRSCATWALPPSWIYSEAAKWHYYGSSPKENRIPVFFSRNKRLSYSRNLICWNNGMYKNWKPVSWFFTVSRCSTIEKCPTYFQRDGWFETFERKKKKKNAL